MRCTVKDLRRRLKDFPKNATVQCVSVRESYGMATFDWAPMDKNTDINLFDGEVCIGREAKE